MGEDGASAILTIDVDAIAENWRLLATMASRAVCAAVVKADAYGLGMERVAPVLAGAGCETFFVALLDEAVALRALLPRAGVFVLNGPVAGTEPEYAEQRLVPVINDLGQLARWREEARRRGVRLPLCLQVDTGMSRFGLPAEEAEVLAGEPGRAAGLRPSLLMSHLACADDPSHRSNQAQLARFARASRSLATVMAGARLSLAASSGVFLGSDYHFDMIRPGAALFGIAPVKQASNPMRPVVRLEARVMQVRAVAAGESVGYGATFTAERPMRVATIAYGYADGFIRSGSNRGAAWTADGTMMPLVGLVSMDSITVDASDAGDRLRVGDLVELIGPHRPLEDVARDAGTIGYEILTALGGRALRRDLRAGADRGRRALG